MDNDLVTAGTAANCGSIRKLAAKSNLERRVRGPGMAMAVVAAMVWLELDENPEHLIVTNMKIVCAETHARQSGQSRDSTVD